jgi:hypothetical protein
MTDDEIREIADDNDSGRTTSGRRLFSDRNLLLFARAIEQASRRAALAHCADSLCNVRAHGGDITAAIGLIRALAGATSGDKA